MKAIFQIADRGQAVMSESGQTRKWHRVRVMSALPPKADIRPRDRDVCFGPKADSCGAAKILFDYRIGDGENA
jgi:hypothetical protein